MGGTETVLDDAQRRFALAHHQPAVEPGNPDIMYAGGVSGGINLLGNLFNYEGPMLYTVSLIHDDRHSAEEIVAAADEVLPAKGYEPLAAKLSLPPPATASDCSEIDTEPLKSCWCEGTCPLSSGSPNAESPRGW